MFYFSSKMATKHMWRTLCLMLLHAEYLKTTFMGGVKYKRQCGYAVTGGLVLLARSSIRCSWACTALSSCQCYGFIYQTESDSCHLLPQSSVNAVAPNDACHLQTCIMVGLVSVFKNWISEF